MSYTPDADNVNEPVITRPASSAAAEFRAIKAKIASLGSGGGGSVAWADITGKPTTRDGYGITDVPKVDGTGAGGTWDISITGVAGAGGGGGGGSTAWADITGTPVTLAGYGITDAVPAVRTITAGTGLSGGGDLSANRTLSLANTAVTPGTYGGVSSIPVVTVDAQGRITGISTAAAGAAAAGSLTGTTLASNVVTSSLTSVASNCAVGTRTIGYRLVPRRTSGFADGECLSTTAGFTINTTDIVEGRCVAIFNRGAGSITITQGAGVTLRRAGTTSTGNRTLARYGMAVIWCESATEVVIGGSGVS